MSVTVADRLLITQSSKLKTDYCFYVVFTKFSSRLINGLYFWTRRSIHPFYWIKETFAKLTHLNIAWRPAVCGIVVLIFTVRRLAVRTFVPMKKPLSFDLLRNFWIDCHSAISYIRTSRKASSKLRFILNARQKQWKHLTTTQVTDKAVSSISLLM